ncbi:MAG TPA: AI-2E family transporter [Stellaceae bacterium]|nr:AI-2E family transporter [Stellaceae bacterium]
MKRSPPPRVSRLIVTAAFAGLGLLILWDFVPALLWAGVLAVATWPLYARFVRLADGGRAGGVVTPLAFSLLVGAIFLVPLAWIAVVLGSEALFVARSLPSIAANGLPVPAWIGDLPFAGHYIASWWQENLGDPHAAAALLGRLDRGVIIDWTRTLGTQLARRSTELVFTLLTLFFLYRDGAALARQFEAVVLDLAGPSGRQVSVDMVQAVRATVNGLVLVGVAEGLLLGIAYAVVGLPHPALLGALTGILAMIPFGAAAVYIVGALMLLPQGGIASAIVLVGIGAVVGFIADHFVRPALIGGAVELPFLWVLLGILGGLQSLGLLGLFLGPAILAALIALWREWVAAAAAPPEP